MAARGGLNRQVACKGFNSLRSICPSRSGQVEQFWKEPFGVLSKSYRVAVPNRVTGRCRSHQERSVVGNIRPPCAAAGVSESALACRRGTAEHNSASCTRDACAMYGRQMLLLQGSENGHFKKEVAQK